MRGPLGGHSISDRQTPNEGERKALERRRGELLNALVPVGDRAAVQIIAQLFLGFHGARGSHDETAAQLALFASQVADLPVWAVQSGCGDLLRRNIAWPPSVGQVRAACEAACQPHRQELAQIEAVLNADVYHEATPSERERVKAEFQKLADDLKLHAPFESAKPKASRPSTPAEAQAWLDAIDPTRPLPKLSTAALGIRQEDAA